MSVSDPLIKDVKACVQQFLNLINSNTPITDNNFYFILFEQTLEKIFNQGLIRQHTNKYFTRNINVFAWMQSIVKEDVTFTYRHCVDLVKERVDVNSHEGRFRLLVKCCLMKKCMFVPVEFLINFHMTNVFYSPNSILGDEILSEILLAVLRQVSKLNFNLDLRNSSFLDTGWYIPDIVEMELVPCKCLGIAVSFVCNKAVIVNIEPNSVAAESRNISIGDILDSLNGVHINMSSKGRLGIIMKSNKNKPVKVKIVKAFLKENGEIFDPIKIYLKELKIDLKRVKKQYKENGNDDTKNDKKKCFYGYDVMYLASVEVGSLGTIKQVQKALRCLIENHTQDVISFNRIDKIVSLEIGEMGIRIRDKETCDMILDHPYMKISSCGNLPILLPKVFGYCAGKENCDKAKEFTCYIFESTSLDDADTILQSIGQGFHRTHYAV